MKSRTKQFLILVIFIFLYWLPIQAKTDGENGNLFSFEISTGLMWGNVDKQDTIVGEYLIFDDVPRLTLNYKGAVSTPDIFVNSEFSYNHMNDNAQSVDMNWKNSLTLIFDRREFRHRTVHDPMTLTESVEFAAIAMMEGSPDVVPSVDYRKTELDLTYTLPRFRNLTFNADYSVQERNGYTQSVSLFSQASPWGVYGMETALNHVTQDYSGGATLKLGPVTFEDKLSYRSFKLRNAPDTQIGSSTLNYETAPTYDKWQNRLSAILNLALSTNVYADYVHYSIENQNLQQISNVDGMSYSSYQMRLTSKPIRQVQFNIHYRGENVNSDTTKWYNAAIPSAIDRDIYTWGVDINFYPFRRTTFRASYRNRSIRRDAVQAKMDHPEQTDKETFKLVLNTRLLKKARIWLEWQRDDVDNPFANMKMANNASVFGESYPTLSSLYTSNNKFRVKFDIPFSDKLAINVDWENGDGQFEQNDGVESWSEKYNLFNLTLNVFLNDKFGMFLFGSILKGDASTFLAPNLADFEFINNGNWMTGIVPYNSDVNTIGLGFSANFSPKFLLSGTIYYVSQDAAADTSALEFMNLADFGSFSSHDSKAFDASFTGEYSVNDSLSINLGLILRSFDNKLIHLDDLTGNGYMGIISLIWRH